MHRNSTRIYLSLNHDDSRVYKTAVRENFSSKENKSKEIPHVSGVGASPCLSFEQRAPLYQNDPVVHFIENQKVNQQIYIRIHSQPTTSEAPQRTQKVPTAPYPIVTTPIDIH